MENYLLAKRVLTGIIAIPLLVALIGWGSENIFLIIVMLTAGLSLIEFYKINLTSNEFGKALAVTLGMLVVWFIYYFQGSLSSFKTNGMDGLIAWSIALITLAVFMSLLLHLTLFPRNVILVKKPLIAVLGIVYVCLFLSYLILIRSGTDGKSWVFFTLLLVWFSDTGAYATGKIIGKNNLFPVISPNKTIEGYLGGLAASLMPAFILKTFFLKDLPTMHCMLLALGIGVMGQLGDLCESTFKRANNLKNSGNLLPGHGGMLDRIDSLLFVAPFVYYYKVLIL